jgi:lipid-binding SYLF domain-containing protein
MNTKRFTVLVAAALALVFLSWSSLSLASSSKDKDEKETDRLQNAGTVLKEIIDIPDNIPQDFIDKAECVMVFPSVVKAAFIVGGSYGRGVMVCRTGKDMTGPWGAPAMMALEAGSVGFQIGGQATDFVILCMNPRGVDALLHSKVKLGADASIAAGPKGRDAQAATDVTFRAEMLSYSRARGVFAGVSLEGSTLHPDDDANRRLYGRDVTAQKVITESRVEAPAAAHDLIGTLQRVSPHHKS